ncbi:hypothetical protein [Sphingomonas yabuuchiae]|uniref:hypothetical protein n=1 Tax=Sphingomonas yabuuchiae TaxID=172044 RepID=UPI001F94295E|nr:hypothetical protein [uncultured Sphingomonas sp.]HIV76887.1 hypothetical protein [Candidatus Sphingomonas excrementigallinarum]
MLLTLLIASTLSAAPAREPVEPNTVTLNTVAVATTGTQPSIMPSKATRYCIIGEMTGSRIRLKTCRTADEWIATEGEIPTGRIARR